MSNYSCKAKQGCLSSSSLFKAFLMSFFDVVADVVFTTTTQSMSFATCQRLVCNSFATSLQLICDFIATYL